MIPIMDERLFEDDPADSDLPSPKEIAQRTNWPAIFATCPWRTTMLDKTVYRCDATGNECAERNCAPYHFIKVMI